MQDPLELATAYLEKSNCGDLDEIIDCFDPDATYHSSQLGDFKGRAAIRSMMDSFYARFKNPRWVAESLRSINENTVEFRFRMTATDVKGAVICRSGLERLEFDGSSGRITAVTVSVDTDPNPPI